jgi:hypothetical protein
VTYGLKYLASEDMKGKFLRTVMSESGENRRSQKVEKYLKRENAAVKTNILSGGKVIWKNSTVE